MFVLTRLQDDVRVNPSNFNKKKSEALTDELNMKFANKVLHNVGLCIQLFDILEVGESFVLPNDGSTYTRVLFRLVVFRPFVGETLIGKIRSSSPLGVYVSLGFFDDILIPPHLLQEDSHFDKEEQSWVWVVNDNKLFMDAEEVIRFKIVKENFVDTMPSMKNTKNTTTSDSGPVILSQKQSPYSLMGAINEGGLGLLSWWNEGSDV